ncbi:hypothetical protein MMC24_003512 [Lignoscripta atroalba]|nr:hypothetical protein [Lignoscripta atroalba]
MAAVLPVHCQLNTLAKSKGLKYFGSATDNPELSDSPYITILSNTGEFGQITPANSMKWDAVEPSQGRFSYTRGDAIASLAAKNGQLLRCHTLVWHNQLPSWVTSGRWTNATLIAALKNHITNQVSHYEGKCYAWDVVNEGWKAQIFHLILEQKCAANLPLSIIAFNEDGTYRTDVFYNIIGREYIPIAFQAAAAADPSAKLYYNDYNIETANGKSSAAQSLIKSLKARGIKVDGIGLQSHFVVGSTPSTSALKSNMAAFTKLGVEVAITELDIRMQTPSTTTRLTQQQADYKSVISACVGTSGCVGVTLWDYTDKYSWVPSTFSGYGLACPWDSNLVKKPAYSGITAAL